MTKEGKEAVSESKLSLIDLIKKRINEHVVIVFSKTYCPYCTKVKQLFEILKAEYAVVELDSIEKGDQIQELLKGLSDGQATVPNVFIGGKHIGGCDDTHALHKRGGLVPLLNLKTKI